MKTIIEERISNYSPATPEDEQHALKEIIQEIILYALSTSDFFTKALFHGGTSLRILYGLRRFSEDLDFILKQPSTDFKWQPYMKLITEVCSQFGIIPEIIDKSKVDKTVQKMFLKDNSIGKIIRLRFHHDPGQKLLIKLEIDTNPPLGSGEELQYLSFPVDYSLQSQDLASNFAGKCHALLCREYLKGRDWFDFLWYSKQHMLPNLEFLQNACHQQGPWKAEHIIVTPNWFKEKMTDKIKSIDWKSAADDVRPFLSEPELNSLNLWSETFFISRLEKFMSWQ